MEEKIKILLVEDELITRRMLEKLLSDLDYQICSCENGEEALKSLTEFEPDLVISDIMMPKYSGLQLVNFINKKMAKQIPVILISSLDKEMIGEMTEDLGAVGFISKPPSIEVLSSTIKEVLGKY